MRPESTDSTSDRAVAIIGMSGRFPGARTIDEFWQNIRDGIESRAVFTDDDMVAAGVPLKAQHPKHVRAGFPLEGYDLFDSAFFGINPKEADILDPQHRVFLECAWHALEDAGCDAERFSGPVGVFAGSTWNSYLMGNLLRSEKLVKNVGYKQLIHGSVPDYMVTRVAYRLNLKGPAYFVQSACSTSLVAVHLGCQSLLTGESDIVLAGGVSISVPQRVGYVYEEGGMESPDARVRAFDANAKGTVFGSGVGVVVLKRLADALRDRDHVYAVIRATAANNDGSVKVGFTAPSVVGQAIVISEALEKANLSPDDIDYIEAHGTGTELGDPVEIAALARVYATRSRELPPCAVGSVKPNIGHLDAAAGVSSLIKTVMAMRHRQLPPSINCDRLNPKIDLGDSSFYINTSLRDWCTTNGRIRRAGVSSFGFGGTNAHILVEEAPERRDASGSRSHQLLLLSARTASAVDEASNQLATALRRNTKADLADVAFTLQTGRRQFAQRRAIVCESRDEACEALAGSLPRWVSNGQADGKDRRVIFLFPGQGAQYVGMARGLYESEPVFRTTIDECAAALQPELGLDLRTVLYPAEDGAAFAAEQLKRTQITQAAVFASSLAMARVWMSWGIKPAAMAGHSIGELVAACLSGVIELPDALRLVALRGRLMGEMPTGAMLAAPMAADRARDLLGPGLWLAAANAPSLSVLAGTDEAISSLERRLAEQAIEGRRLHTSHAFHSGLMDGAVEPFVEAVRGVKLSAPEIPYVSNVTGDWASEALVCDAEYWGRHIRETVKFSDGLARLLEEPGTVFLEVGPGNTLSTFVRQQATPQAKAVVLASMRHPHEDAADLAVLLHALGRLWVAGAAVDWVSFYEHEERSRIPLPGYPFERTKHWVDPDRPSIGGGRRVGAQTLQDDLANWFYVHSWKRAPAADAGLQTKPKSWLVFADDGAMGAAFVEALRRNGHQVAEVRPGKAFEEHASHFTIDPAAASDYVDLVKRVYGGSLRPTEIVHLWGAGLAPEESSPGRTEEQGFYALLFLAQALGSVGVTSKLRLHIVTHGLYSVIGSEALIPARATLLGPARVIPLEFPNITTRSIDFALNANESAETVAAQLLQEIDAVQDEPAVAIRNGRRWALGYEPMRLEAADPSSTRLRDGGTYLITGGTGGIGLVLAEHLASTRKCNLVLTARTGLPPRTTWDDHLARTVDDAIAKRIRAIQRLEAGGARVLVCAADVADEPRMREVVDEAIRTFGSIDGAIHAAGVAGGGVIQLKEPAVAASVLRPKVEGTQVLGRVLATHKLDFLLLCSSLTAVLGGPGQVDYCAGNAFMDAFAPWYRATTGTYTVSVNWSAWKEVGMAVETDMPESAKGAIRQQLLAASLTNRDGAEAFARILGHVEDAQVAVSLIDVQVLVDRLREREVAEDSATAPANSNGQQRGHARPDLATPFVAARTDVEHRIAAIWREMLGVADIGMQDNFFDLGGHSLLAVRVMARLNDVLGTEIPVAKLYDGLTIGFLARLVEPPASGDPKVDEQAARDDRRDRARRQKEHQQRRLASQRR